MILYLGLDPTHYHAKGPVTHWPIIQIIPRPLSELALHNALNNFEQYTHVIITSKSSIPILQDYLTRLAIPLQIWTAKVTLAVGQATAKCLEACGIIPFKIAQEETAEGLIKELKQLDLKNAHLFWPHSSKARPVIDDFLTASAIRYTSCNLYEPKLNIPGELPSLESFDEIVFTSPSTVDAFLEIFKQFPLHSRLTTIGPITANHLSTKLPKT